MSNNTVQFVINVTGNAQQAITLTPLNNQSPKTHEKTTFSSSHTSLSVGRSLQRHKPKDRH